MRTDVITTTQCTSALYLTLRLIGLTLTYTVHHQWAVTGCIRWFYCFSLFDLFNEHTPHTHIFVPVHFCSFSRILDLFLNWETIFDGNNFFTEISFINLSKFFEIRLRILSSEWEILFSSQLRNGYCTVFAMSNCYFPRFLISNLCKMKLCSHIL